MVDPLSVLGAAVGVTSLIIQVTDECVKGLPYSYYRIQSPKYLQGYRFYSEAANTPATLRYLRMRMQMEQRRFIDFGLEAGVLYVDGEICATLQTNRTLLLAVLAEVKDLLHKYAERNEKYERILPQEDEKRDDYSKPGEDFMDLLSFPTTEESKDKDRFKGIHDIGRGIVHTARNIRKVAREPRRLKWAAVDKKSFEELVSKLEDLNSFLISLLDRSQIRLLQETTNANYQAVLQLQNDIQSLTILVQALEPGSRKKPAENTLPEVITKENLELEKIKNYLQRLAKLKILYTKMNQLSSKASIDSDDIKEIQTQLELEGFLFAEGTLDTALKQHRTGAIYKSDSIWIEWKDVAPTSNVGTEQIENRIKLLTDLLGNEKPEGFRAPECLGYIKAIDSDEKPRFGIVYKKPTNSSSGLHTLRKLLMEVPIPSLSARISLGATLARCVHSFHAVNWMHKGLRSDNIIFLAASPEKVDLKSIYVSGFELSRPGNMPQMTERPVINPLHDIYRHPNTQAGQSDGNSYQKSYDIYSLGVVLIEIALWQPIEEIVGFVDLAGLWPPVLQQVQNLLLGHEVNANISMPKLLGDGVPGLRRIAPKAGDVFEDVVECCLKAHDQETPRAGESEEKIAVRLQTLLDKDIVKKLEKVEAALQ
jgi:hypothetical protein